MSAEIFIKYTICTLGLIITIYNFILIRKKTKRSKTTWSLEVCCLIHLIVSALVIISLALREYTYHKYFDYISLEIIILSLCIQIMVWLSWFRVFRMQFAYLFSMEILYIVLNYISLFIYISAASFTFVSYFKDDQKVLGIKRCVVVSLLVLWFSLVELVISISTFILNYKKHLNWVKLREQQLQKLASINPNPMRMIPEVHATHISTVAKNNMKINEKTASATSSEKDKDEVILTVSQHSSMVKPPTEVQKTQRTSQGKISNENLKSPTSPTTPNLNTNPSGASNVALRGGSESIHSLTGSVSKKSCLSYECIDKTILHYMHDKSVDFANTDPRATENNIKLITILHILIYIFHGLLSILILVILLCDWKYSLQFLLLYTQTEITIKLQDHFLLRQFIDLSLT